MFSLRPTPSEFLPRLVTTAFVKPRRPRHALQHSELSYQQSKAQTNIDFTAKLYLGTAKRLLDLKCLTINAAIPVFSEEVSRISVFRTPGFLSRSWPAAREEKSEIGQPISTQNNKAWCWSTWAPARPERASFAWRERDWPPCCLEI